jgi:hypothetical protein
MPDDLPGLIREVQGHRLAFPLMFCEISRRLHRQRVHDPRRLTQDLIEAACPGLTKYVTLYQKDEVEYHEAVRYGDWLSYRTRIKPRNQPAQRAVPKTSSQPV